MSSKQNHWSVLVEWVSGTNVVRWRVNWSIGVHQREKLWSAWEWAKNVKKIEAFPIDRTRGISVPAGEWMIFDEMQNAPTSLFKVAMARAEHYGKVVICGDKVQKDVTSTKPLGMEKFLDAWNSVESVHQQAVLEAAECKHKLQGETMTVGQGLE